MKRLSRVMGSLRGDLISLGLAVCQSIVQARSEAVEVGSEASKDTRFAVRLPRA